MLPCYLMLVLCQMPRSPLLFIKSSTSCFSTCHQVLALSINTNPTVSPNSYISFTKYHTSQFHNQYLTTSTYNLSKHHNTHCQLIWPKPSWNSPITEKPNIATIYEHRLQKFEQPVLAETYPPLLLVHWNILKTQKKSPAIIFDQPPVHPKN